MGNGGTCKWEDISVEDYEHEDGVGGPKQVLLCNRDGSVSIGLRYYELSLGGQSSFDFYYYDHGVFILRGRGRVLIGSD